LSLNVFLMLRNFFMKIGLLGLINGDLSNVSYEMLRFATELGFHGVGAHLSIPAETVLPEVAARVPGLFEAHDLPFLQLWGPYPCIISPDEHVRMTGVHGAQEIVKLAARMGVKEAGVRPTSLNPRGDWWPHRDNYLPETEDRLVQSLSEILTVAEAVGVDLVLEAHVTTTLRSPEVVRRVIERTSSKHLKLNLDPCNFIGDLPTAFDPAAAIHHMFDVLEPYIATVHLKDFYFEDRLVVHISETVIGTGELDFTPILERVQQWNPEGYVVIEHLPVSLIGLAKRNLTQMITNLGYKVG